MTTLYEEVHDLLRKSPTGVCSDFLESIAGTEYNSTDSNEFIEKLNQSNISFEFKADYYSNAEEECWSVYKFFKDKEEAFVKFNGWVSSYSGSKFTNFSQVVPKEIVVTIYEEV